MRRAHKYPNPPVNDLCPGLHQTSYRMQRSGIQAPSDTQTATLHRGPIKRTTQAPHHRTGRTPRRADRPVRCRVRLRQRTMHQFPRKGRERDEATIRAWARTKDTEINTKADEGATLMFLGESGFSLRMTLVKTWARKGRTPTVGCESAGHGVFRSRCRRLKRGATTSSCQKPPQCGSSLRHG